MYSRAVPGVKRARPIFAALVPEPATLGLLALGGLGLLAHQRRRRSAPPYGPPYSPDLNPIEKMWSKVRQFLRRVKARTQEALWQAIGAALQTVSDTDAVNWFRSCGYCYE